MKPFTIIPIPGSVARDVRRHMKDDRGHQLAAVTLASRALCRLCLHDGETGVQKHILFSYMPADRDDNPYAEVGPVYIHDDCEPYDNVSVFPPDLKKRKYLTVRGYSAGRVLVAGEMSEGLKVEESIGRLFERPDVDTVQISDATTGCFFVKVARG